MPSELKTYGLLINGQWIETNKKIVVKNKYTGEDLALISKASRELASAAVEGADKSFRENNLSAYQRFEILKNTSEKLLQRKKEIAEIIIGEVGKPWKEAIAEVERAAFVFNVCGEEAKRISGDMIPLAAIPGSENRLGFTLRQPLGVVCAITPFNFPLMLTAHKVGPAIAAGNTVIIKPASSTPISSIILCETLIEAGLPKAHVQLLTGNGGEVGEWLTNEPKIKKFSLTGSVPVGVNLKNKSGLRKVTLELGSNSPTIVHFDADVRKAAELCMRRGIAVAGQACISVQRVYVHEQILETFLNIAKDVCRSLVVGDPYLHTTDVGPMISEDEAIRVEKWIKEAVDEGAKIECGGKRTGNFFEPTIITKVNPLMKIVCEELFAPVITVIPYSNIQDAINWANDSQFGLQAGIFTSNIKTAIETASLLEFGGVMINDTSYYRGDTMPYGGVKNSGIGREGPKYAIEEMMETKSIVLNL